MGREEPSQSVELSEFRSKRSSPLTDTMPLVNRDLVYPRREFLVIPQEMKSWIFEYPFRTSNDYAIFQVKDVLIIG